MKLKAKDQLLGNYGIAAGSFALLFVIVYGVSVILMTSLSFGIMAGSPEEMLSLKMRLITQVIGIALAAISLLFFVGYLRIMKMIADGESPSVSELFFVFRNHPDKIIIITLVVTGIQFILLLPSMIAGSPASGGEDMTALDGKRFLLYIVLYLAGLIISYIIDLMLAMSFMIYLDDPDASSVDIMRESIRMMKGSKFRYFFLTLSFIGYWLLIALSFGIAMFWVIPYQTMSMVEFYLDLRGDRDAEPYVSEAFYESGF
ncbi:MAG: DUF975 family protein [Lachnospiraceae bacterium]|nr:DUF975 family protein [Lachnospiraceae bacterium]